MVRINNLTHSTKHDTTFYVFLDFTNTTALNFCTEVHSPWRVFGILLLGVLECPGKEGYMSETLGPL